MFVSHQEMHAFLASLNQIWQEMTQLVDAQRITKHALFRNRFK